MELNLDFDGTTLDVKSSQEIILLLGERGVPGNSVTGSPGAPGRGIVSITDNGNYTYTFLFTDGTTYTTSSLKGAPGDPGPGVDPEEIGAIIDEQLKAILAIITEMSADNILSPGEKRILNIEILKIISEKDSIVSQAILYGLIALKDLYLSAYNALILYINPILANPTESTAIVAATFNAKFTNFYVARANLAKATGTTIHTNVQQAVATAAGAAAITNFWKITLDDQSGIIAAGTMLVGTATYNNAGMTGVTDQGDDSVRFFAGANYANKNTAPFRVLNNGKIWSGTAQSGYDFGITSPNRFTIRGALTVDSGGNVSEIDVYRGTYDPVVTYFKGNTVTYNGSLWRYINDLSGAGFTPIAGDHWTLVVSKGDPGTPGTPGAPGVGTPGNGVEYRYQVNGSFTTAPTAPNPADNDPAGWTIVPPTYGVGQYLWRITAVRSANGTLITTWSAPLRETGIPGSQGEPGIGTPGVPGVPGSRGPFVIDRGIYNPASTYHGGTDYIEVATYNSVPYHTRTDAGNFSGIIPTNAANWDQFQVQFDSLYVNIFSAVTAYIDQLIVKTLKTAEVGARIAINENNNNSFRVFHDNGVVGIDIGIENGTAKLNYYDRNGVKIYELGQGGLKYVTLIAESWADANMQRLANFNTTTLTEAETNALSGAIGSTLVGTNMPQGELTHPPQRMDVVASDPTRYLYNAGQNPSAEANAQYEGYHVGGNKTDGWVINGWFVFNQTIGTKYHPADWSGGTQASAVTVVAIVSGKVVGQASVLVNL
jgi:hypothetical protein